MSHSIQPPRSFIGNYTASSLDTTVAVRAQGERLTMLINEIADELRLPPNTIRRRIQTATEYKKGL